MTRAVLSLILLASTTAAAVTATDNTNDSPAARAIELKASQPSFVLGRSIDLRAVYHNATDKLWKLEEPESSAGVRVYYEQTGNAKPLRMAFSFSRMTAKEVRLPDGETRIVYSSPPTREIEIPPGGRHELTADIYAKWTEDLAPGDYEVWVEDTTQKLKSSRARFSLVFSKESIPALLDAAGSEKEHPAKRKWCASWLKKIQPAFEIKSAAAKEPPEPAKQAAEDNARAVRSFKAHWEKVKDTKEVEALFAKPAPRVDLKQQQPISQGKEPR